MLLHLAHSMLLLVIASVWLGMASGLTVAHTSSRLALADTGWHVPCGSAHMWAVLCVSPSQACQKAQHSMHAQGLGKCMTHGMLQGAPDQLDLQLIVASTLLQTRQTNFLTAS